ncbi:SDR family NAD(P)-dependent oxidoreductase [Mesonia sp.]|uniref:SDR family NAD(P)-dependent oxidoreductase n=1 Tax=Mesonia sp. TaxID=1960830 RepID=UPI003F94D952
MKNILLIGGSHGIGLEIVKQLHKEINIIVASRTNGNLSDLEVTHHTFDAFKDNLEDLNLPEELDGFIYCPGTINLKPFKMLKQADFEEDMQKNFISLVNCTKAVLPRLKKSDQASIVYFSTVAVQVGMPFHTSVAASKGAIEGFAKALAAEYAPTVRVNVIAPSLTNTSLAENILSSDKKKEMMDERHPLKRVGEATDIAHAATYLLSKKSSWMTGQVIHLDGGMSTLKI